MAKRALNKSAWIRSQSPTMAAKDVVAKAKAEGIKLSIAQVYTARSSAKSKLGGNRQQRRPGRPAAKRSSDSTDVQDFRRLVLKIGLNRAEELLSAQRRELGL